MIILSYTVTLNAEGGEAAYETKKVPYGTEIEEPTATRSGYNFIAWVDADGKEVEFPYAVKADVTFKAKWEKGPVFTVVYEAADGVTYKTKSTYNVKTGDKHTLKAATDLNYTNTAKSLKNWLVRPADAVGTDSAVEYAAGEEITVSGNLIVTPVLSSTITVTFKDGIDEAAVFTAHATADGFNYVKNGGADFKVMGAAATASIGDGGTVVIDNEPTKVGYTFAGYCIIEPEWADRDETIVKKDATTNKPIYKTITFDPAEPVTDDDGDGVVYVHVMWDAVDLNAVAYSSETASYEAVAAVTTPTAADAINVSYNSLVKGLAIDGDETISADEAAAIKLTYDAVVMETGAYKQATSTPAAKPAIFVPAPSGIASDTYLTWNLTEAQVATLAANTTTGGTAGTVVDMKIDGKTVYGAKIEVPAATTPYVVLQFTKMNGTAATSAKYVINLTTYTAEELSTVSVDMNIDAGSLYKGEAKAANLVKPNVEYFDVCTLQMPVGAKIETPEAGSLIKVTTGTPSVTSAFAGLDVLDANNRAVTAEDGVYTVPAKGLTVTFNWGATATVTFKDGWASGTYNGVKMDPVTVAQKTVYKLPECELTAPTGEVFAGWDITVTPSPAVTITGTKPVGYELSVGNATAITLKAHWAEGYTLTYSANYGDDANTSVDETVKEVFSVLSTAPGNDRIFTVPADPIEEFGWTAPEGYTFGGWKKGTAAVAAGDQITLSSTDKAVVLTAQWIPEITFRTADAATVAELRPADILLGPDAAKTLVGVTATKGETAANGTINWTIGEATVPYTTGNTLFSGTLTEQSGHYVALQVVLPTQYKELLNTTSTFDIKGLVDRTGLSVKDCLDVDKSGKSTTNITFFLRLDGIRGKSGDDKDKFTFTFHWSNGGEEKHVIDFSAVKFTWPVTYKFGKDANNADVKDVVTTVEDGALLTVSDEAKAVSITGKTVTGWKITKDSSSSKTYVMIDGAEAADATVFDPLDKGVVVGPVTLTADTDDAKVTLTVDLDGGTVNATTSLDGITATKTTKEVTYGTPITLPSNASSNGVTKPGALLTGWKVDGELTKPGKSFKATADTKIEAVWQSYLGTLDVATLKDAAAPSTVVVKADSYKVGEYDPEDETGDRDFIDLKGKTGTCVTGNKVNVVIRADELVEHANTTLYGDSTTAGYWVGLKITPPEGLSIAQYKMTSNSETVSGADLTTVAKELPASGAISAYLKDPSGENNITVTWLKADGTTVDSPVVYAVKAEMTKKYSTYTVKTTLPTGIVALTDNTVLNQSRAAGKKIQSFTVKADPTHYWDEAKLAKLTLPEGFSAEIKKLSDGVSTTLTISGTVSEAGYSSNTITLDFSSVINTKDSADAIYASDFTFTATGDTTGDLTNGSDVDVVYVVGTYNASSNPYKALAAEGTAKITELDGTAATTISIIVPGTYTTQPSVAVTIAPVQTKDSAPSLAAVETGIEGAPLYVSGFDPTKWSYEYRKGTTGEWTTVTANAKNNFQVNSTGSYQFRISAKDDKLASPAKPLNLTSAANGTTSTISIFASESAVAPTATYTTGADGVIANSTLSGKYTIKGTGIVISVTSSTAFTKNLELVPAAD